MFALSMLALVAVSGAMAGEPTPPVPDPFTGPVVCQACQQVANGLLNAVSRLENGLYADFVSTQPCAQLFGADAVAKQFCEELIKKTGTTALATLLQENSPVPGSQFTEGINNAIDVCIALGACAPKECPTGFTRSGNTNACYKCFDPAVAGPTTDFFSTPFWLEDAPRSARICSIRDYFLISKNADLNQAAATWVTSEECGCTTQICPNAGGRDYIANQDPTSPYYANGGGVPFFKNYVARNWVIDAAPTGAVLQKGKSFSAPVKVCLCADFFRPEEYGQLD